MNFGGIEIYFPYIKKLRLTWEWHEELFSLGKSLGVIVFSTPFDFSAVDFLEEIDCPLYKIASMETGDIPLIKYIAKKNKPIIASTGSSTLSEIDLMVETIREYNNNELYLLLCTSSYPTPLEEVQLNRIKTLKSRYGTHVGLSDHTQGIETSIYSVCLGSSLIEKHFILDKNSTSLDSMFSINYDEMSELVERVKLLEDILGNEEWEIQSGESESRRLRRSLIITKDVKKGEVVSELNVKSLRPNIGIEPKRYEEVIGKLFKENYNLGDPLSDDKIE